MYDRAIAGQAEGRIATSPLAQFQWANKIAAEKARIPAKLDHIAKMLAEAHAITNSIENCADRVAGPVPETAAKGECSPRPDTVEARLQEISETVESLAGRLHRASERLNASL